MKQIDKLLKLSRSVLSEKDYKLVAKFTIEHDFESFSEIINSELKKESRLCVSQEMTERYCALQNINFMLIKYDTSSYIDKCPNYEDD